MGLQLTQREAGRPDIPSRGQRASRGPEAGQDAVGCAEPGVDDCHWGGCILGEAALGGGDGQRRGWRLILKGFYNKALLNNVDYSNMHKIFMQKSTMTWFLCVHRRDNWVARWRVDRKKEGNY